MPIYEYGCNKCGEEFSFLKLSQSQEADCPKCSSKDVKKRISVFSAGNSSNPGMPAGHTHGGGGFVGGGGGGGG